MSEWIEQPIRELIEGQWPGEWGTEPDPSFSPALVYRSTDLDDSGHLQEDGGVYRSIPATKLNAKKLLAGDILLEASGGSPDRPVGRVALFSGVRGEPAICANFLRTLRPKKGVCSSFLRWALVNLQQQSAIWRFQQQTTGMINLKVSDYLNHQIETPSIDEQRWIAEILSTVDETIEQTEALIAKYQQIKAELMHDLFTRGVTPDGRLRPTRAQAPHLYKESPLGWIPKEWKVSPAETLLARIIDYRGRTPTKTVEGIPLVTAKNVRMGYIDPEPREFIAESDYAFWMTRGIPNVGDVLFTTEAPLGNVAQIETTDRVAFAQRVIVLQPGPKVRSSFLKFVLMSDKTQRAIARLASGTTALGIKQSEFRKVLLSHPSDTEEQELIEAKLEGVDGYLHGQQRVISKLHQEKHGLMRDLLTGRVRVKVEEATMAQRSTATKMGLTENS